MKFKELKGSQSMSGCIPRHLGTSGATCTVLAVNGKRLILMAGVKQLSAGGNGIKQHE